MKKKELLELERNIQTNCAKKMDFLIKEEKSENPRCRNIVFEHQIGWGSCKRKGTHSVCGAELEFDVISKKYFCPDCNSLEEKTIEELELDKNKMLVPWAKDKLVILPSEKLVNIILLRENRFNYLLHEWEEASRGNAKAEFFLNRLKSAEQNIIELKSKIKQLKKGRNNG